MNGIYKQYKINIKFLKTKNLIKKRKKRKKRKRPLIKIKFQLLKLIKISFVIIK